MVPQELEDERYDWSFGVRRFGASMKRREMGA
jgi:hypothetical protein